MVRMTKTGRVVRRPVLQHLPPRRGGEIERALQEKHKASLRREPLKIDYAGIESRAAAEAESPRTGLFWLVFERMFGKRR